tara:strand:+ start:12372 stop:12683 length:312 start_codon:yes stop_codon:yes gene_type:complete
MHVRDYIAIAGFAYGVLSDSLGANRKIKENSLVGLFVGRFKSWMGYAPKNEAEVTKNAKVPAPMLIDLAHQRKKRLLEDPNVESVEAALLGNQIVLTVVRRKV